MKTETHEQTKTQQEWAKLGHLLKEKKNDAALKLAKEIEQRQPPPNEAEKTTLWDEYNNIKPSESLQGLIRKLEIATTYERPAPTLRDFLANTSEKIEYFVEGLITENARCYLASPPKSGKSIFTMYMALCAASGKPFFNRDIKPCPVVMIDQENALNLNHWRMRAIAHGLGLSQSLSDLPIMPLFHEGIMLTDEASIEKLKRYITEFRPGLITVDSLIRCTRGLNENSADDMNELAEVIAELKRDTGQDFTLVFLHHTNKSKDATGQERVRGSGDLTAMVDHGFLLEKSRTLNGNETFGLTEPSPRYSQGSELYYQIRETETKAGDMVNFSETTRHKGKDNGEDNDEETEIDTKGF